VISELLETLVFASSEYSPNLSRFLKYGGPGIDPRVASFCASQWIPNGTSLRVFNLQFTRICCSTGYKPKARNTYIMKSDYEWHKQRWDLCKGEAEEAAYIRKAEKNRLELCGASNARLSFRLYRLTPFYRLACYTIDGTGLKRLTSCRGQKLFAGNGAMRA
jgi:hypothetical protein